MYHCTRFYADTIWFLEPNSLFENRELRIGTCPICNKQAIELKEKRKVDGKIFTSTASGDKTKKILDKEKINIIYTTDDVNKFRIPFGWRFGMNILTRDGKEKQYACDWFNNKELIREKIEKNS